MSGSVHSIQSRFAACLLAAVWTCQGLASLPDAGAAERVTRIRALPETALPFMSTVVATSSRAAAVSEPGMAVAISHLHTGYPLPNPAPPADAHVSIYRLDASGVPVAGEPVVLTLPKPASLANRKTEVLGLACHPQFPLLYVWQDVEPLPEAKPTEPALYAEFDHLLIYSLEESPPKLLLATARGNNFHCGASVGGFSLDASARRLYVPNLQRIGPLKSFIPAIGWMTIEPDGLPAAETPLAPASAAEAGTAAPSATGPNAPAGLATASGTITGSTPTPPTAPLDPAAAAAARAVKLAAWAVKPTQPYVAWETATSIVGDWPAPYNYAPINDNAVLIGAYAGIGSWVLNDRLGRFGYNYMLPMVYYRYRVTAHPALPAAYVSLIGYDGQLQRFELADGCLTLVPKTLQLDNVVVYAPPLVIAKGTKLALAAANRVCIVDLDDKGDFTKQAVQMAVYNPKTSAIAWSEKFSRLYVAIEKTP